MNCTGTKSNTPIHINAENLQCIKMYNKKPTSNNVCILTLFSNIIMFHMLIILVII